MSASLPCSRIILCGPSEGTVAELAALLKQGAASLVDVRHTSAFTTPVEPGRVLVTASATDVFGLKKMKAWSAEDQASTRVIICMRDPRDLLLEPAPAAGGEYRTGYDHSLHIAGDIVTLTGPGLGFLQQVSETVLSRDPGVMLVRHEDLYHRPMLVHRALRSFTGLDLALPLGTRTGAGSMPGSTRVKLANDGLAAAERARLVRQFRLYPNLFTSLEKHDYEVEDDRRWFDALAGRTPDALDDSPGCIVGFHTPDALYVGEAERMRRSVEALGLPIELTVIPLGAGWLSAVQSKPGFLLSERRRLRGPLLYVDVDAVIHSDPWPYLRGYDGDVAVAGHHGQAIISGTVLINDTPGALAFLEEWALEQAGAADLWDQHCLETVVRRHRTRTGAVRVQYLPPEMCAVFNRKFSPPIVPVIEHLQASREQFAGATDENAVKNLSLRRQRVAELDGTAMTPPPGHPTGDPTRFGDLPAAQRSEQTRRLIGTSSSDLPRWSEPANLKSAWKSRAKIVAALIAPGSVVLDLGCGAMDLEAELAADCVYLPADLVARDARTIIIDLNTGRLPNATADVVTMLGVLEYVHQPDNLFRSLARRWSRVVLSYNPADLDNERDRHSHGWFNALRSAELVTLAARHGYRLQTLVPHGTRERIYDLVLEGAPS